MNRKAAPTRRQQAALQPPHPPTPQSGSPWMTLGTLVASTAITGLLPASPSARDLRQVPRLVGVLAVLLSLCAAPMPVGAAQAQNTLSTVQGTVLDASGAPIAGAVVTVASENQNAGPSTTTNERGEFSLGLGVGRYTVTVVAPGFGDGSQSLTVASGGARLPPFVLSIATIREAVTVSAAAGYRAAATSTATKTLTPLRDVPQAITVVTQELMKDQLMMSVSDVVRYVPGITTQQGENNRDQLIVRGNNTSADFFVNGVRDDVQYFRDIYNIERVEALKGPNAMIFGRGGAGGVVNRVQKEAGFQPLREVSLQGGMYGNKRLTTDVDQPLSDTVAFRMNGMFESSSSFRTGVDLDRYGVTPTVTIAPSARTKVTLSYEYLHDTRTADRGITSFRNSPADVDPSLFYGNPNDSQVKLRVNLGTAAVEHQLGKATIRNRTVIAGYDRFYQNFVPGAPNADATLVPLTVYNNATQRTNVFNQTDFLYAADTGGLRHTFLTGAEFGRQLTDNFRNTGFFNNSATSLQVPFVNPTITTPVTFRQNATDADNHLRTSVAAAYAQDQVELSRHVQVLGGIRVDRFDLQYHNNRNGDTLTRPDTLVSPRAGLVLKPITPVSIYGSYSVSYLPSSGDQFSSLTTITEQVKPEKFNNYEVGLKWDARPSLAFTTAVYRLDRTNTRSTDPNDPTRIVQTGSQRTNGFELGVNGSVMPAWTIAGGYAYQDAFVTSATAAAAKGKLVGQVPHHTVSLWNNYRIHPRLAAGLGIIYRADMFAAIDNTVLLPGYTRADAAAFFSLTKRVRVQANVENLFDALYYVNADNNTNISPGFPRTLRVGLTTLF
jgi:catecholate siderophore receptor